MAAAGAAATELGMVNFVSRLRLEDCRGVRGPGCRGIGVASDGIPSNLGQDVGWGPPRTSCRDSSACGVEQAAKPGSCASSQSPCTRRGGPGQARRPLLRCGGHLSGTAALVEDHGDVPGPVALFPDQWAECPAGEILVEEGAGTARRKVETQLMAPMFLPSAPAHGASHCRVYPGVSAPGRPGEAALHRCA
jgi:hypothetical protein